MQVYPSKKHVNDAELLYTKLLPSLNSRLLQVNVALGLTKFLEILSDAKQAMLYHDLAHLGFTTQPAHDNNSFPSTYSKLPLMAAAVDVSCHQIVVYAAPMSMDPEETRVLQMNWRISRAQSIHGREPC